MTIILVKFGRVDTQVDFRVPWEPSISAAQLGKRETYGRIDAEGPVRGELVNLSVDRTYRAVLRRSARVVTFPHARSVHIDDPSARHLHPGGVRAVTAGSLLLKHKIVISNRSRLRAPNLTTLDRFVLGLTTLFIRPHRTCKLSALLTTGTLLKFRKALVDRKYRLLFSSMGNRGKPSPKRPSPELIAAIVELKTRNPKFGCVGIAQQIADAFGIELNKDVVRRVLEKHYKPNGSRSNGPSWLTFIALTKGSLWSVDLFRCESILLRSHWVMVVMDVFARRIIGFGVEVGTLDGVAVCRMFNAAVSGQPTPGYISTDHDPLFRFHWWRANPRVCEIDEVKSVPYVPTSHPIVERLIGTVRREYLDRVIFWNSVDLTRKLAAFRDYYNAHCVHSALGGTAPDHRAGLSTRTRAVLEHYTWRHHCGGLFQTPLPA